MTTVRRFIIVCNNTPLAHRDSEPYWLQFSRDADVYPTRAAALVQLKEYLDTKAKAEEAEVHASPTPPSPPNPNLRADNTP